MRDLSKNDWRVLAELLEMASESSIKHGVDEFKLDNTKENLELVVSAELWDCPNDPCPANIDKDDNQIYTDDSFLMRFFASIARENVE